MCKTLAIQSRKTFFLHNIRFHWSALPPQNKAAEGHRAAGRKDKQEESMQN